MSPSTSTEKWQRLLAVLENEMSPANFNRWIEALDAQVDDERKHITLLGPNQFFVDYVRKNYHNKIVDALKLLDYGYDLSLKVAGTQTEHREDHSSRHSGTNSRQNNKKQARKTPPDTEVASSILDDEFTFDRFVVGQSNKVAHAVSESVAHAPGTTFNPLYIHGSTGMGKTHLVQAIGNHVSQHKPDARIRYMSGDDFVSRVITSFQVGDTQILADQMARYDILIVDDIQTLAKKKAVSQFFFEVFNKLYQQKKQIVLTSDVQPREIEHLDDRIRSRFASGMVAEIQPTDIETRFNILKKKIEDKYSDDPAAPVRSMNDDLIMFMAENITSSVRELQGALVQLNVRASLELENQTISRGYIERTLAHQFFGGSVKVTAQHILGFVAKQFGVSESEIMSKSRAKGVSDVRQIVMHLCRELTEMSFPDIAKFLKRDHSTIVHGDTKIRERMQREPEFKVRIETIARTLVQ